MAIVRIIDFYLMRRINTKLKHIIDDVFLQLYSLTTFYSYNTCIIVYRKRWLGLKSKQSQSKADKPPGPQSPATTDKPVPLKKIPSDKKLKVTFSLSYTIYRHHIPS